MAVNITDQVTKKIQRIPGRTFLALDIDRIELILNKSGQLLQIKFYLKDGTDPIGFPPEDMQAFKNAGIIADL